MNAKLNYYQILGISNTATLKELKDAYKAKCKENHPDVAGNSKETHEKMCKINEAYEVLSDVVGRREYDYLVRSTIRNERVAEEAAPKAEPKAEETAQEQEVKFEWSEPIFKNEKTPNRSDFEREEDYYDVIYKYYDDNDYKEEEYKNYIVWLDYYMSTYMDLIKAAFFATLIEVVLYEKVIDSFNSAYQFTVDEYNWKYNTHVLIL